MNILDTPITVFESVVAITGSVRTLAEFLNDSSTHELINQIRSTDDKAERTRLKAALPCAVISAICPEGRKADANFQHTGLICIDIDGQDNTNFINGQALKAEVCKVAEVAYCSLSASGNGCFAIFRLSNPEKHLGHFRALQRLFKSRLGIAIDGQCKDVKRLRFATLDSEPYVNEDAPVFRIVDAETKSQMSAAIKVNYTPIPYSEDDAESTLEKVDRLTKELVSRHIDLTDGYQNWIEVGMALADLGEAGREYFHAVSSIYSGYNQSKANAKFTNLLRTTRKVGIGTFFHLCQAHGLDLSAPKKP